MGDTPAPQPAEMLIQLVLRARLGDALVHSDQDWEALGSIAGRMLFWYGGAIYACRCEGSEMRFALQVLHASLGTIAHQIAAAYATHLRKTRGLSGAVFRHYVAIPLHDDTFLDDLVLWLHRTERLAMSSTMAASPLLVSQPINRVWTADDAYLTPKSLPWIETTRILSALSIGAPGPATYRRRKSEPIPPRVIEFFTRRPQRASREDSNRATSSTLANSRNARPNIETIARIVAEYCDVRYEDMLTHSRRRAVSRARVIATVLATRNGATAAAAARLFNRSRSTLIEQVEHYRASRPQMFPQAEAFLEAFIARQRTQ